MHHDRVFVEVLSYDQFITRPIRFAITRPSGQSALQNVPSGSRGIWANLSQPCMGNHGQDKVHKVESLLNCCYWERFQRRGALPCTCPCLLFDCRGFAQPCTGSSKIIVPLFENSRPSAASQLGQHMHSQSANFGKLELNSRNLAPFLLLNPVH